MTPEQLNNLSAFLKLIKNGKNDEPITDELLQQVNTEIGEDFINQAVQLDKQRIEKEKAALAKKDEDTKLKLQMGKESIEKLREGGFKDKKQRRESAQEIIKQAERKNRAKEGTKHAIGGALLDGLENKKGSETVDYASEDFEKLVSAASQQEAVAALEEKQADKVVSSEADTVEETASNANEVLEDFTEDATENFVSLDEVVNSDDDDEENINSNIKPAQKNEDVQNNGIASSDESSLEDAISSAFEEDFNFDDSNLQANDFEDDDMLDSSFNTATEPELETESEVLPITENNTDTTAEAEFIEENYINNEFQLDKGEEGLPYIVNEDDEEDISTDEYLADEIEEKGEQEIKNGASEKNETPLAGQEIKEEFKSEELSNELTESEKSFVEDINATSDDDFQSLQPTTIEKKDAENGNSAAGSIGLLPLEEVSDLQRLDISNLVEKSSKREETFEAFRENEFKFLENTDFEKDELKLEQIENGDSKEPDENTDDDLQEDTSPLQDSADELSAEEREKQAEEFLFEEEDNSNERDEGAKPGDDFYNQVATDVQEEIKNKEATPTETAFNETLEPSKSLKDAINEEKEEDNDVDVKDFQPSNNVVEQAIEEKPKPAEVLENTTLENTNKQNIEPATPSEKPDELSADAVNSLLGNLGDEALELLDDSTFESEEDKQKNEEKQQQINYERALGIIETYSPKNKKIILGALEAEILEDEEANIVAKRVLNGDDEDYVAAYVANREYLKTFKEDHKKDISTFNDQQGYIKEYYKKQRALKFLRLVAVVVFLAVFSFTFIFYGIGYIRSTFFYYLAYDDLKKENYLESEEKFVKAYEIRKSLNWVNDFGTYQAMRGRFEQAEKKYLLALQEDENHRETLLNYGDLHIYTGDFFRAQQKFKKILEENPGDLQALYAVARNHTEWGLVNISEWGKGDIILTDLIEKDTSNRLKYLAKKLEIASLRDDYEISKFYYDIITNSDAGFYDRLAFRRYTDFLIENYEKMNTEIENEPIDFRTTVKNNYTVNVVEKNIRKILEEDPNYFPIYYSVGNWFDILNESDKGEKWLEQGIAIFEENDPSEVYTERYPPINIYNLKGKLEYNKQEISAATEMFRKALEFDEENSFGNYYLGKIELLNYENLEAANTYFKKSYNNWSELKNDRYRDLVYSIGYYHYRNGLENNNEDELRLAVEFWSVLTDDRLMKEQYILEFALAQVYLRLKKYDLGEAYAAENIRRLQPNFDFFKKNEGRVVPNILQSVGMLSDSYNNLGVAYAAKAFSQNVQENRYVYKQKAVENFVNSITLKEELDLLRGVPYANFNRINAFPQRIDEFIISDELMAKQLLP